MRSPATRDALSIAPLMLMIGRPQTCKLARNPVLRGYVADRLRQDWSPQQIAGVLAKHFSAGSRMRVSHETIYKSLFIQSRGGLAKELQKHLRSGRPSVAVCTTRSRVSGARRSPKLGRIVV